MRAEVLAALEESLAATPDPEAVLRGINTGIDRRRRRNRCYRTGFTIVAVVLLVIVAVSAQAQPPDQAPAVIPVGEWKNTIRPTWLPAGLIAQHFTATLTDESISYRSGDSSFSIEVGNGGLIHPGNAERISIGGRPAVAWSESTGTTLGFELPSGRWAMVALSRSRPAPELIIRDEAIRIARSIEETGDRLLRIGFAPSYLPAGHRVVGVHHGNQQELDRARRRYPGPARLPLDIGRLPVCHRIQRRHADHRRHARRRKDLAARGAAACLDSAAH